jgi:hypothetical protein
MAKKQDKQTDQRRDTFVVKMERGAQKAFIEELFNDIYAHRLRIFGVNFVRGIAFSVGGILGATIVIALLIWTLSLFSDTPIIGQFFKDTVTTIKDRTN